MNNAEPDKRLKIAFTGRAQRLFWLVLGRMALTVVTFGIARFWMITRLRRYYWSAITIAGAPLEYTGRAGEKLLGFLVAVVFLAVYLFVVNMALAFIGLAYFQGNPLALNLSLLAIVPLAHWAQYRARRYILARTRWRGIRFGVDPGAGGYTWRAMMWWGAVVLSLGILYPWMHLSLTRYATNRSWFGDAQFRQGGRLWPLLRPWLLLWAITIAGLIGITTYLVMQAFADLGEDASSTQVGTHVGEALQGPDGIIVLIWAAVVLLAYIRYRVVAFRYLNSEKSLGAVGFTFTLGYARTLWVIASGYGIIWLAIALVIFLTAVMSELLGMPMEQIEEIMETGARGDAGAALLIGMAVLYLALVILYTALRHIFLSRRLVRAVIAGTVVTNPAALDLVRQRAHDEQAEAGGFADALGADPGAAF